MMGVGGQWFLMMKIAQYVLALMTLVAQRKTKVADELLIKRLFSLQQETLGPPEARISLEQNLPGIDFVFIWFIIFVCIKNLVFYVVFVYVCGYIYIYILSVRLFSCLALYRNRCVCQNLNVDSVDCVSCSSYLLSI